MNSIKLIIPGAVENFSLSSPIITSSVLFSVNFMSEAPIMPQMKHLICGKIDESPFLSVHELSCSEIVFDEVMAVMVFSEGHIWCMKRDNDAWFNLDSLSDGPKQVSFRKVFVRQGFGWIIVWKPSKLMATEEVIVSSSQISRQQPTKVAKDLSAQVLSKRANRRHHTDEHLMLDKSFLEIDVSQSSVSNRFDIFSNGND